MDYEALPYRKAAPSKESQMSSETRIERIILRETMPDFFRELAHMFENGGGNGMESIAEFRKMKISIEEISGRIAVQIKFKGPNPEQSISPG
jgi:hypothetical protein